MTSTPPRFLTGIEHENNPRLQPSCNSVDPLGEDAASTSNKLSPSTNSQNLTGSLPNQADKQSSSELEATPAPPVHDPSATTDHDMPPCPRVETSYADTAVAPGTDLSPLSSTSTQQEVGDSNDHVHANGASTSEDRKDLSDPAIALDKPVDARTEEPAPDEAIEDETPGSKDPTLIIQGDRKTPGSHVRMRRLALDFVPSAADVMCGRGRTCKMWKGNIAYRKLVESKLDEYAAAKTKLAKGAILSSIVEQIRKQSPTGGFVKQDPENGHWYEVGDFLAREKTSQCFRDALHDQYSSSAQAKYKRRKKAEARKDRGSSTLSADEESMGGQSTADEQISLSRRSSNATAPSWPLSVPLIHVSPHPLPRHALVPAPAVASSNGSPTSTLLAQNKQIAATIANDPRKRPLVVESQHTNPLVQQAAKRKMPRRPSENTVANVLQQMAAARTTTEASSNRSSPVIRSEVRVCALQLRPRQPHENPLDATRRALANMDGIMAQQQQSIDIFVLPELCPVGYCEDTFARYLPTQPAIQTLYRQVDHAFAAHACKLKTYICYGTIGWKTRPNGTLALSIRQVVIDRSGQMVATYDKGYLCDYGVRAETRFFEPGPGLPISFDLDGFRFGLLICGDMRYPDLARALARYHKVDVLLQPAALARDVSFRTWKSFRETRAVENSCYFVGVNYAGDSYGETSVVPPWVDETHEPMILGTTEGYLTGRILRSELDKVRATLPFYRHLCAEASRLEKPLGR